MHSLGYLAICVVSLASVLAFGAPEMSSMVVGAALAIAVLGVPHGGLDHWVGRRLLKSRFSSAWWAIFFPAYLFVGCLFALGWFLAPTSTVVLFFLVSAWHFGREDQQTNACTRLASKWDRALVHLVALAIGGLVIWIPALVRPDEMRALLSLIVPATGTESFGAESFGGESINNDAASRIVGLTQIIGACLVPCAVFVVAKRLLTSPATSGSWVPLATAAIAIGLPILLSFPIYFCGWHSWQGLRRLRHDESLQPREFVRCVAPLSIAATLGVAFAGWWMHAWSTTWIVDGEATVALRTLFIGLSAIAVPHLLLHEFDWLRTRSRPKLQVYGSRP